MAYQIEERFGVEAPLDRVWDFIIDPHRVVVCLPGAELTEQVDEKTYLGNVKVKVGPVTMAYKGKAFFDEVDAEQRRIRVRGEGREKAGTSTAKMTMDCELTALAEGGTEVVVHAEIDLKGRIVQFGRGMITQVTHQVFQQFAEAVRQNLEAPVAHEAPAPGEAPPGPSPYQAKPVRALPLVFKALWAGVKSFFRRIFGRKKNDETRQG